MKYVQEEGKGKSFGKEIHPRGREMVKVGRTGKKSAEEGGVWASG